MKMTHHRRASWLDATIEAIRGRVDKFRHLPPAKEGLVAGTPTNFIYDDGSQVVGFLVGAYRRGGEEHHFLVLARIPRMDRRLVDFQSSF